MASKHKFKKKVKYQCPKAKGCKDRRHCDHATKHEKEDECNDVFGPLVEGGVCPACVIVEPFKVQPPFISKEEMTL